MKNTFSLITAPLVLFLFLCTGLLFAQEANHRNGNSLPQVRTINNLDTIYFDLSQAVYGIGFVDFPVFFNSDDTIYAVDFAFRYNSSAVEYDSIIPVNTSLSYSQYLNPADSTFRFTSFSLTRIPDNSQVVMIRMNLVGGTGAVLVTDLYAIEAYLNGSTCSYRVIDGATAGINAATTPSISAYPNPTSDLLTVTADQLLTVALRSMNGETIKINDVLAPSGSVTISVADLPAGLYAIYCTTMYGNTVKLVSIFR